MKPGEEHDMYLFQKSKGRGDLGDEVFHFLHCAVLPDPKPPQPPASEFPYPLDEFAEKFYSIEYVYDVIPEARDHHALHDYVFKRIRHLKPDPHNPNRSVRRSTKEMYENDGLDAICEITDLELITSHRADVFIVWGEKPRKFFLRAFEGLSDDYGIYEDVLIGDKSRTVVFLPHPTYLGAFSSVKILTKIVDILERLYVEFNIDINIGRMENRIRSIARNKEIAKQVPEVVQYPGLAKIKIKHTSPEELLKKRREHTAAYNRKRTADLKRRAEAGEQYAIDLRANRAASRLAARLNRVEAARQGDPVAIEKLARTREVDKKSFSAKNARKTKRRREMNAKAATGDPEAIQQNKERILSDSYYSKMNALAKDGDPKAIEWMQREREREANRPKRIRPYRPKSKKKKA